jgi:hypothetical protein
MRNDEERTQCIEASETKKEKEEPNEKAILQISR